MCSTYALGNVAIPALCQKVYRCCKLSASTLKMLNSVGVKASGWTHDTSLYYIHPLLIEKKMPNSINNRINYKFLFHSPFKALLYCSTVAGSPA
jgi:hypothetical protein